MPVALAELLSLIRARSSFEDEYGEKLEKIRRQEGESRDRLAERERVSLCVLCLFCCVCACMKM